jgi:hypothetical protein
VNVDWLGEPQGACNSNDADVRTALSMFRHPLLRFSFVTSKTPGSIFLSIARSICYPPRRYSRASHSGRRVHWSSRPQSSSFQNSSPPRPPDGRVLTGLTRVSFTDTVPVCYSRRYHPSLTIPLPPPSAASQQQTKSRNHYNCPAAAHTV